MQLWLKNLQYFWIVFFFDLLNIQASVHHNKPFVSLQAGMKLASPRLLRVFRLSDVITCSHSLFFMIDFYALSSCIVPIGKTIVIRTHSFGVSAHVMILHVAYCLENFDYHAKLAIEAYRRMLCIVQYFLLNSRAAYAWVTKKLKGQVKIPLVASNRINMPSTIESFVEHFPSFFASCCGHCRKPYNGYDY